MEMFRQRLSEKFDKYIFGNYDKYIVVDVEGYQVYQKGAKFTRNIQISEDVVMYEDLDEHNYVVYDF